MYLVCPEQRDKELNHAALDHRRRQEVDFLAIDPLREARFA
jgi:hypothetical protein